MWLWGISQQKYISERAQDHIYAFFLQLIYEIIPNYRVTSYTWPCFSGTSVRVTFPVYTCTVPYTGQVTFTRYQKNTVMFNWSPCTSASTLSLPIIDHLRPSYSFTPLNQLNGYWLSKLREATKKVLFFSGPATKAFNPPPHSPRLSGHRNFFFRLKIVWNGFWQKKIPQFLG